MILSWEVSRPVSRFLESMEQQGRRARQTRFAKGRLSGDKAALPRLRIRRCIVRDLPIPSGDTSVFCLRMLRLVQVRLEGCLQQLVEADLIRRVQRMLGQPAGSVVRPHRMANPDFPLRGTVLCPRCGRPLTAASSLGHGGRYPHYRCMRCSRVTFRKERVEP